MAAAQANTNAFMAISQYTTSTSQLCNGLPHVLLSYMKYHNEISTHLSLEKDAPVSRAVKLAGAIFCHPVLGGLHHQYVRI